MRARAAALAMALLPVAATAAAQRLEFRRDTSVSLTAVGVTGMATVLLGRDGRMLVLPTYSRGEVIALDSTGRKRPWSMPLGRGSVNEIMWVGEWGWIGDSLWVMDPYYRQIAIVGRDGRVARSIRFPSWVRPFWRDRRTYPLFNQMSWHAVYGDGSLLVEPKQPRRLLDTPGYDPSRRLLARIDADGRILRTVATAPAMEGRMQLRSGTERRWVNVPNYPRSFLKVSSDGERVAVAEPLPNDSGAFRVTLLDSAGDTVFTRRYVTTASRIDRERVDSGLGQPQPLGRYSSRQIRDTILALVPTYTSPVAGLDVGLDYSVWVAIRGPRWRPSETEWLVLDASGAPQGTATLPNLPKVIARRLDRYWAIENDRVKQWARVVIWRRTGVRGVPPSRTARASASPSPGRPRE